MEKLNFNVTIDAPRERVWEVLWGDESYPDWTKAFSETSYAKTDWQEGSKVLFLDGSGSGMVSEVAKRRDNEYMSFRHLGEVRDGVEDTTSESVKQWAGSMENYTLKDHNGGTELLVEMDINAEHKDMFAKMWPNAIKRIKELSERGN